jgi:hypothetical protein
MYKEGIMGIFDNVKNLKDKLEANVSNMMKGMDQFGEEPQEQTGFSQMNAASQAGGSFCPECGTRVEAGGRFCPSCGTAVPVQSVPEAASSKPPQSSIPLNPALTEHQRTTIFDFNLADKKETIETGKFVVEGVFSYRVDTTMTFKDPEDEQSIIRLTINQRPPKIEKEQKATIYFHCEDRMKNIDELVLNSPDPEQTDPEPTEHQQTTIFDFILADNKESIETGRFVVEGIFSSRNGTDMSFIDPEDEESEINLTLNQRPPKLVEGQKVTVYFHCKDYARIIDEMVPDSSNSEPANPKPANNEPVEYRQTTIFDFILAEDKETIETGKFIVEGVFDTQSGTTLRFADPGNKSVKIAISINQRVPELKRGQKATIYFHCEDSEKILDELVLK